jgi:S1-C subfamily serine protease
MAHCKLILGALTFVLSAGTLFLSPDLGAQVKKAGEPRKSAVELVVDKVRPAVVIIHATKEKPTAKDKPLRSGLGVIIDPKGIVVMPRRLVEGIGTMEVVLSDGRKRTPKTSFADAKADLAIVQLETDKPLPCAECGDSDKAMVGDRVLSLDLMFGREITVERGLFTGKQRAAGTTEERLYMDSARSVPSERDLLFDMEGKLIGVWTPKGAVPIPRVKEAVRQWLKNQ